MNTKPLEEYFPKKKDENLVESKMPKPLEEYFPKKKSVKIMVRQHDRALKRRKLIRKRGQNKPKYTLRDPTKLRSVKKAEKK